MPRTPTRPVRRRLGFEVLEPRCLLSGEIAGGLPVNPVNETDSMIHLLGSVPGGGTLSSGVLAGTSFYELQDPATGGCATYEYDAETRAALSIAGTVGGSLLPTLALAKAHNDGLSFEEPVAGVLTVGRVEHMNAQASLLLLGNGTLDARVVGRVSLRERETCTLVSTDDEGVQQITVVVAESEISSSVNLLVRAQGSYALTIVMYVSRETVLADRMSSPIFQSITHESTGVLFAGLTATRPLALSGTGTVKWNDVFSDSSGNASFKSAESHVRIDASGSAGVVAMELYVTANTYIGSVGPGFGIVYVEEADSTARVSGNGTRFYALGIMETSAENFSGVDARSVIFVVGPARPVASLESGVRFVMDPKGLLPEVLKIRDDVLEQFSWLLE